MIQNRKQKKKGTGARKQRAPVIPPPVNARAMMPGPMAIPTKTRRTLRYCDQFTQTTGSGTIVSQVYRANSCYDPDFSNAGHQPMGFDDMMNLYTNCTVIGSRITVDFASLATQPVMMTLTKASTSTAFTESKTAIEQGAGAYICSPVTQYSPIRLTEGVDVAREFSKVNILDDVSFACTVSADTSTATTFFYHVLVQHAGVSAAVTVIYFVCIDYDVWFTEPKRLAAS